VPRAKLCVVIVSYDTPADVRRCLASLAQSRWSDFAVFVCENAGAEAFARLRETLSGGQAVLEPVEPGSGSLDQAAGRLAAVAAYRLRGPAVPVRIGAASDNLGYGGGVNAWLERLLAEPGWEAVLVLNPDTELDQDCLGALMAKAAEGYGMVGPTLVFDKAPNLVISYGLIWSRLTGRVIAAGRNAPAGAEPAPALLARLDAISGACVLVTRAFVEDVGLMAEDYFLYMEDLDWGMRRGRHRIGVAARAIVRHIGGTAIGSAVDPRRRSRLSNYLMARNLVRFSRRRAGAWWAGHLVTELLYAARCLIHGAPAAARDTLIGAIDGARGKSGRPAWLTRPDHG